MVNAAQAVRLADQVMRVSPMHTEFENSAGVVGRSIANGFFEVRLADGAVRVCFASPELQEAGTVIHEGDRVTVGGEENGVFRGEITRVRPEPRAQPERATPRASLITRSAPDGLKPQDQRVDREARPDWPTGAERAPEVGDVVYCTAGMGTVLRVLGRTGNGSRLLELRLPSAGKVSFFASGSNVLMAPRSLAPVAAGGASEAGGAAVAGAA